MTQSEFLNIVMPFKDKVFRLAKRLLVSTEEAEDATHEMLLKLWANKTTFQDYTNVLNSYKNPHTGFEKVKMVVVCHVIDKEKKNLI